MTDTPNTTPAPAPSTSPAKKSPSRSPRPRRAQAGDTAPSLQPRQLERHAVQEKTDAAQQATSVALKDILAQIPPGDTDTQLKTLETFMTGLSADDALALRNALLSQENALPFNKQPVHPDDELARDWRHGGYPYKNLMSRRNYEREKYRLQVELLKLQAWVKETGQKVVILFEGRDAAGKGGSIKRFMEHLNPRGAHIVALEKPSEAERGQCTSSVTCSTCRPPTKSSCSTAAGTTAPGSSGSWVSARTRSTWSSCARRRSSSACWRATIST